MIEDQIQRRAVGRIDQLGMRPVQRLHHDARIDFQHLPGAVDADDIDRAEAHVDRSRGLYRNLNAGGGARFALIENDGLRARTEIVAPVQRMASARGRNLIERGLADVAGQSRQDGGQPIGRDRCDRQLQHRALAVARDRQPVLAEDDDRPVVDQDDADFILDLDVGRNRETLFGRENLVRGDFEFGFGPDLEHGNSAGAFVGLDDEALRILLQQIEHRRPRARGDDVLVHRRTEKRGVRNAGDAAHRQHIRCRALVVGDPMRDRAVQSEVISEGKAPLRSARHGDEPAVGLEFDVDAVTGAIFLHGSYENAFAVAHSLNFSQP